MFRFSVFGDLFDEAIKNGLTAIQVIFIQGFSHDRITRSGKCSRQKYGACEEGF